MDGPFSSSPRDSWFFDSSASRPSESDFGTPMRSDRARPTQSLVVPVSVGDRTSDPRSASNSVSCPTGEGLSFATLSGAPPHMGNRNPISARQYLGSPSNQQQLGSEFGTPYALKLACDTSKIPAATPARTPTAPRLQASPPEPSSRTLVPPRRIPHRTHRASGRRWQTRQVTISSAAAVLAQY